VTLVKYLTQVREYIMNIKIKRSALGKHSQKLVLAMNKLMRLIDAEMKYMSSEECKVNTGCYLLIKTREEYDVFAVRQHLLYQMVECCSQLGWVYATDIKGTRKFDSRLSPVELEVVNMAFDKLKQIEARWKEFDHEFGKGVE